MLGIWLFGNAEASQALIFRALPLWAIYPTLIFFPVTIALAELPTILRLCDASIEAADW